MGFGAKPLINPQLGLLYDVFLWSAYFFRKQAAASYNDIMETEFFSKLNVGGR